MLVEDVEIDTFWHCDAADEEQEDNGCVAHLVDSCWRLVASCDVSNEVTLLDLSPFILLWCMSVEECMHSF